MSLIVSKTVLFRVVPSPAYASLARLSKARIRGKPNLKTATGMKPFGENHEAVAKAAPRTATAYQTCPDLNEEFSCPTLMTTLTMTKAT